MSRSSDDWREISKKRNDYQLASYVLADLVGYNPTCRHKEDDIESLMHLIGMLRDEG